MQVQENVAVFLVIDFLNLFKVMKEEKIKCFKKNWIE